MRNSRGAPQRFGCLRTSLFKHALAGGGGGGEGGGVDKEVGAAIGGGGGGDIRGSSFNGCIDIRTTAT